MDGEELYVIKARDERRRFHIGHCLARSVPEAWNDYSEAMEKIGRKVYRVYVGKEFFGMRG